MLWTLTGIAALVLTVTLGARTSTRVAENRIAGARAGWHAEGCAAMVRARADSALVASEHPARVWLNLDSLLTSSGVRDGCTLQVRAHGATADINRLGEAQLRSLLGALGRSRAWRDSLTDAILDWRDPDGAVRAHGAEAEWYDAAVRPRPRNAPFASTREIALVRGAEAAGLDSVLGADSGRVLLTRAPVAALVAIDGIDEELARAIVAARVRGDTVGIDAVAATVSPWSGAAFLRNRLDVMRRVTNTPERWAVVVRSTQPVAEWAGVIKLTLARHNTRAAVVEWRRR
ncbi:MAG: general secretion pathway protein GspK [Gemmatimonadaceae bacterium]|nr:general secretion pathway protein GspK [Gemmatimonadaceae bacterium]